MMKDLIIFKSEHLLTDSDIELAYKLALADERRMSTIEVAELTGREHQNVLRDVNNLTKKLSSNEDFIRPPEDSTYTDSRGRVKKMYLMDIDFARALVGGYDANIRYSAMRRLNILERAIQIKNNDLSSEDRDFCVEFRYNEARKVIVDLSDMDINKFAAHLNVQVRVARSMINASTHEMRQRDVEEYRKTGKITSDMFYVAKLYCNGAL